MFSNADLVTAIVMNNDIDSKNINSYDGEANGAFVNTIKLQLRDLKIPAESQAHFRKHFGENLKFHLELEASRTQEGVMYCYVAIGKLLIQNPQNYFFGLAFDEFESTSIHRLLKNVNINARQLCQVHQRDIKSYVIEYALVPHKAIKG